MRWTLAAVALAVGGAALVIAPVLAAPGSTIVCGWVHPDCLGNHWLLSWVADQVWHGRSLVHNDRYYWPVGDAPWLAGNGSDGFLYLPWHLLLGWPRAAAAHTLTILTLNGLGGWALARAAGASPAAALTAASTAAMTVYATFELGAGRFSQADMGFLAFFLASWLRLLQAPSWRRAVVSAMLLAATSALYWYYGLFAVIAGAVLLAFRGRQLRSWALCRPLLLFAVTFLVTIAPLLWVFLSNWAAIPGTGEAALFPHPEATADSCWPGIPFLAGAGRHAGRALPLTTFLLAGFALFRRRDRVTVGLAAVGLLFAALMAGPLIPHGPYEWIYGIAEPLKRFWWPYRHVVVVNFVYITLAAVAVDHLPVGARARTATGVLLALSIPAQLALGRAPYGALFSEAHVPVPFYQEVGALPGTVLIEPPLTPDLAASQATLMYQLDHGKALLNGHALWVQRVRPVAWDAFVDGNSFLAACRRLERGALDGHFRFDGNDLTALFDQGVLTITVNREYFPAGYSALPGAYHQIFDALFGEAAVTGTRMQAWDMGRWTGAVDVAFEPFAWPATLERGGPTLPVRSPAPPSAAFAMPRGPKK
ncbi:MAG: hypothetical protein EXR71_09815 [Myxococcales bacterium]|nr:hypothetical protein [Myxococcales bacterium]